MMGATPGMDPAMMGGMMPGMDGHLLMGGMMPGWTHLMGADAGTRSRNDGRHDAGHG